MHGFKTKLHIKGTNATRTDSTFTRYAATVNKSALKIFAFLHRSAMEPTKGKQVTQTRILQFEKATNSIILHEI